MRLNFRIRYGWDYSEYYKLYNGHKDTSYQLNIYEDGYLGFSNIKKYITQFESEKKNHIDDMKHLLVDYYLKSLTKEE